VPKTPSATCGRSRLRISRLYEKIYYFVTGTPTDFGKLAPRAVAVRNQGVAIYFYFFVTGMHMLEQYGHRFL